MDPDAQFRAVVAGISKNELHKAAFWLNSLGQDWRGDVPLQLHQRGSTEEGTLPFSDAFDKYVGFLECQRPDCGECRQHRAKEKNSEGWRNPEPRLRATRAFRKLRKIAPREFDAVYMHCVLGQPVVQIASSLTQRAIRLGKPERYGPAGTFLLLYSGISKVLTWW